jgi:cob(I)alamin adenosyltransferase
MISLQHDGWSRPRGEAMKIYTRSGDKGRTSLFSGERVSKAASRVEAYGDVDELNSVLGALAASLSEDNPKVIGAVEQVQRDLFCVGGRLATTPDSPAFEELPDLEDEAVKRLETEIDGMEKTLPPLRGFILPGGHPSACWAHVARTVCRRAERRLVAMLETTEAGPEEDGPARMGTYLNRLSDYLFVLARYCNHVNGVEDTLWES